MGAGLMVSYLCNAHMGGGEVHAHQIAKHLTDLGEDITYVAMACPHPNRDIRCPDPEELHRFEATCGYPIERIRNTYLGSGQWKSASAMLARLRLLWDIYRVVRRRQAEYIVLNQSLAAALCLAAKAARIPVIQIVHHVPGDMGPGLTGQLRRWLFRLSLRMADVNVCVSSATEADVAVLARSKRVTTSVIRNAIDVDAVDAWRGNGALADEAVSRMRERGYPDGHRPVILTVARLVETKGIQWVIRAMPQVLSEYADARYVVVGEGPYRAELERMVEAVLSPHLRGAVTFLGRVSDSDKFALYDACDLFVMPSTEEGFGLVYVEAGAFGKPVVGCDLTSVSEAVVHGETGLLVPPADADAVAGAVLNLLRDENERLRLGQNGRRRVESMSSWREKARQYRQLIWELKGE